MAATTPEAACQKPPVAAPHVADVRAVDLDIPRPVEGPSARGARGL